MPSINVIKEYRKNGVYHVYNRGVNKTTIFRDENDYGFFLALLERLLTKPSKNNSTKNFHGKITLYTYCLINNHFHFQLKQSNEESMFKFMQCLSISYARWFNHKHGRVGHLFQDRYKARLIKHDADFINTSKYIHRNPSETTKEIRTYPYSSIKNYSNKNKMIDEFIDTKKLLSFFNGSKSEYEKFVVEELDRT